MTQEERQQYITELERLQEFSQFGIDSDQTNAEGRRQAHAEVEALTAAIDALEREGQMEAQPAPDLESVRRLVEAVRIFDDTKPVNRPHSWRAWQVVSSAIQRGIPALRSLLAEVQLLRESSKADNALIEAMEIERNGLYQIVSEIKRLREENDKLKAALEEGRDEAKVRCLRAYDEIKAGHTPEYYRGANDACNDLAYHSARLLSAITKAAEEGLSR